MKAIEFQSHLIDGKILVPAECGLQEGQDVRVLILVKDDLPAASVENADHRAVWKRTEGAWHGELVREDQGGYPVRFELEY
jgi:hypothetical protein